MKFKTIFLSLFFSFFYFLSIGQQLSDNAIITLLTCAPGDEVYTVYGHNAIRIQDPEIKLDKVYNYGTFDFSEPNFMLKFMQGKLRYRLAATSFRRFIAEYNYEKRDVLESRFSLTSLQKQYFYELLEENLLPKNKFYMYDFFYDNCATRIRDMVEKVVGTNLIYPEVTKDLTLRNMLDEYTDRFQWLTFGQALIVGGNADIKADMRQQMFIPDYLNTYLKQTNYYTAEDVRPLIIQEHKLIDFKEDTNRTKILPLYIFILFLIWEFYLFIKLKSSKAIKIYDKTIFSILGLASILIIVMWFFTDHGATKDNWNLLWINPLFIVLVFLKKQSKYYLKIIYAIIIFTIIAICYKLLPQDFYPGTIILMVAFILNLLRNYRIHTQNQNTKINV